MKKKLLYLILFFSVISYSQEDAWVFLLDKENVSQALSNPITILTQEAIDRKALHGVAIDERDVPVNENYITQLKGATGITVLAKSKWMNAVHVRGTETDITNLETTFPFVDYIEFANKSLNVSVKVGAVVDKFEIENTQVDFNYGNTLNQVEMISADYLHEQDYTGQGIVVAVMDAGFPNVNTMAAFQRLRDNGDLLDGYDFVDRNDDEFAYTGNSHGTRVLSTMAAHVDGQFVGTAPDASYYLFRTEDAATENPVEESYWVEAVERADSLGVDIVNTSLGYKTYDNVNYSHAAADLDGYTAFITRGSNIAYEKGLILINSAGNSGTSGVNAPADSPFVLSIGAVDENGNYVSFSSQGSAFQPTQKPNVVARGSLAYVVGQDNSIVQNNGTSFSSPILAGAVACLRQALPNLTNQEIMDMVEESASQYSNPDYLLGYGIPDFQAALSNALSSEEVSNIEFKAFPNPVKDRLYIQFPAQIESCKVELFSVLGNRVLYSELTKTNNTLDVSQLSKGIYIVSIKTSNNNQTIKLLKE